MDDFFLTSDPWSDFFRATRSPTHIHGDLFMTPASSSSRPHRRPAVMSPMASTLHSHNRPTAPAPAHRSAAPAPSHRPPAPALARSPRVVSIPVEVDGGDGRRASSSVRVLTSWKAATTIQKVFRGFVVRRMVGKVSRIAAEMDAIEKMMTFKEEWEKIRSQPRERLRVGDTLMGLLLRLDSVRGVREFRRKVIRRVIRMQEMVDSTPENPLEETPQVAADSLLLYSEGKETTAEEETKKRELMKQEANDIYCDAIVREEDVAFEASDELQTSNAMETRDGDEFMVISADEDKLSSSPTVAEPETFMERLNLVNDYLVPTAPPEMEMNEVLDKVLGDNRKLHQLVATLHEQIVQQHELLEALVSRVCNLEKTLLNMENEETDEEEL